MIQRCTKKMRAELKFQGHELLGAISAPGRLDETNLRCAYAIDNILEKREIVQAEPAKILDGQAAEGRPDPT